MRPQLTLLAFSAFLRACSDQHELRPEQSNQVSPSSGVIATIDEIPRGSVYGFNIIAMRPDGGGQRQKIPFLSALDQKYVRAEYWGATAQPVLARTDFGKVVDVNLFSIAGIQIKPQENKDASVTVTIDLGRISLPKWAHITEQGVVIALLTCFIENEEWQYIEKPEIRFLHWPWDEASRERVLNAYATATRENPQALNEAFPN